MNIRFSRWVWVAFAVAGLALMFRLGRPYRVMDRPKEASFAGRWILDPASLPSVKDRAGAAPANAQLLLDPDGRLTVTNMPYEDVWSGPRFVLVTGEGRWQLDLQQDWVMTFSLKGRAETLKIRLKDGAPAVMTHAVGDPDSNELWIWNKVP